MDTVEPTFVAGSRQTVQVVNLPGHGRGRLVWRNGPAFFAPDEGTPFWLYKVMPGGSRTVKPIDLPPPATGKSLQEIDRKNMEALSSAVGERKSFSYERVQIAKDAPVLEAEILERGDTHNRYFSPIFGDGWLVHESTAWWERFETLDGEVKIRFQVVSLSSGRPAYVKKMRKAHSKMPAIDDPDEFNWSTVETKDGSVLTFRRGGPPPPEGTFIPVRPDIYKLLSPKARKAYDAAQKAKEVSDVKSSDAKSTS